MELLVVMVIVAIIAGFGVPSFSQFIREGELTSRANSVLVALQLARSEAITRGRPVMACPSTNGTNCSGGNNWAEGWLVATDGATAGAVNADDEVLRVNSENTQIATTTGPQFVRFDPEGLSFSTTAQTIELQRPECGSNRAREIEITATGRARVNKADC